MCFLFALSASKPQEIRPFIAALAEQARQTNRDGWGVAAKQGERVTLVKETNSLHDSMAAESRSFSRAVALRGQLLLVHLRDASMGERRAENTHPFRRRHLNRVFLFMHDGDVPRAMDRTLARLQPAGQTDSERAFLALLEALPTGPPERFAQWLLGEARSIGADGRFNFVLSEGDTMWVFSDGSIHWAQRLELVDPPGPDGARARRAVLRFDGDDGPTAADEAPGGPQRVRTLLVSSGELTQSDRWESLERGRLLIVRNGRVLDAL